MSLLRELQQRNVIRVATAYIVSAWLIIQVVETIFPAFGFGDVAIRIAVIALAIGFVPALIGAWVFEWTPQGLRRDAGEGVAPGHARTMDRAIIVILLLGIVYFAFDKFVLAPERAVEREAEVAEQAVEDARKGFYGDRSIAVLPFDNMSGDPEQVYFVDGVAEEILNLLARIRDLRVISRSSSFTFRGEERNIPEIAATLDVAHILEGSVRKAGNRVRVTAQLIEAHTDTHLWSKTYERELDDVFQIQDEIAADVVRNLELTLDQPLPHSRKVDPEVVALVQQARQVFEIRMNDAGARMTALLERALELDPGYAPAIEWMGVADYLQVGAGHMSDEEMRERAQVFRNQLLQLDPASPIVDYGDAFDLWEQGEWERAAETYLRALDQDLSDSMRLRMASLFARSMGKLDIAERLVAHAVAIDPLCYQCIRQLSQIMFYRGDIDAALKVRERYLAIGASGGYLDYAMMLILSGKPEAVPQALAELPDDSIQTRALLAMAAHSGGDELAALRHLRVAEDLFADGGQLGDEEKRAMQSQLAAVYGWMGDADKAFATLMPLTSETGFGENRLQLFHPQWKPLRDDPRWAEYREALGMSEERFAAIEFDPWLPE